MRLTTRSAALLLLLALPVAVPAQSGFYNWTNKYDEGVIEPPRETALGWNVNEVPHNVTLYFDVNNDGRADIAFAHSIIAMNTGVYCDAPKKSVEEFYWVFSTCPSEHAADYYVTKQWILYRILQGGGWKRLFMLIDEPSARHTTNISQH